MCSVDATVVISESEPIANPTWVINNYILWILMLLIDQAIATLWSLVINHLFKAINKHTTEIVID